MPRIRTIKPEFFLDEDMAELKHMVRLAFIGLWCEADKDGRLEDRPKRLKATIFPYEQIDMDDILNSLNGSFITRYEVEGRRYIQINTFLKHQRPHHTEKNSTIPPVPGGFTVTQPLPNGETPVGREGKGREGKGKEGKGKKRREYPARFEQLWKIHPKGGKDAAYRAMKTIGPDEAELDRWIKILEAFKATDQWRRGVSPNLSTWINQGYFDGEIPKSANGPEDYDEQKHQERIDQETLERRATSREWEDDAVPMPEEIRRTIEGTGKKLSAKKKDEEKEGDDHEQG